MQVSGSGSSISSILAAALKRSEVRYLVSLPNPNLLYNNVKKKLLDKNFANRKPFQLPFVLLELEARCACEDIEMKQPLTQERNAERCEIAARKQPHLVRQDLFLLTRSSSPPPPGFLSRFRPSSQVLQMRASNEVSS
jgi:hypothetical protein